MAQIPAEHKTSLWSKKVLFKEAFKELANASGRVNHENKLWALMNLVLWQQQHLSRQTH
jgi:hypothetical protein